MDALAPPCDVAADLVVRIAEQRVAGDVPPQRLVLEAPLPVRLEHRAGEPFRRFTPGEGWVSPRRHTQSYDASHGGKGPHRRGHERSQSDDRRLVALTNRECPRKQRPARRAWRRLPAPLPTR